MSFPVVLILLSSATSSTQDEPGVDDQSSVAPEATTNGFSLHKNRDKSWARWTFEQFKFFAPQGWDALWEIGPVDAFTSGVIGMGVAEYATAEKYPGYGKERYRNAFRHCYGSCLDYQMIGDDSLIAMDIHEKYGAPRDGACDSATDRFNNDVGVSYAKTNPDGDCHDFCSSMIETHQLMLDPGNPDSAEDANVTAICNAK